MAGLVYALSMKAQPECFFTHYSSEDGLSQNTVMGILQDRKGNMWFATWNGLNKFNGYSFKAYKARLGSQVTLTNDRMDQICEDAFGFIWVQTYDNHAFRFNPRTEQFEQVPAEGEPGSGASVSAIRVLPDGTVWLLTEKEGAIRVTTDAETHSPSSQWFSNASKTFPITRVYGVYEDTSGNEWMLTDNGLGMIAADNPDLTTFLVESTQRGDKTGPVFYAAEELGEEVFFGSDNGKVWRYHKKDGKFLLLQLNIPSRIVALKKLNERELLIATATDGVFIYQSSTGSLEHYTTPGLTGQPVHSAYMDKYSEVWFEQYTSGTIIHFNPSTRTFKTEHIAVEPTSTDRSRPAFHVHEDIYGTVWVHPYGGGFSYFDREHNLSLIHI